MNIRPNPILAACAALLLSACSTLKDTHCGTTDWAHIGTTDAYHLRPSEFVLNHEKVCGAGRVNVAQYQSGFDLAMSQMCTPKDGFLFGYLNKAENPRCKPDPALAKAYRDGVAYQKNSSSLSSLSEQKSAEEEREKADDEARRHESLGKMLVRGLIGDGTRDSDSTQASIDRIREEQKDIERTYEGALLRARWVKSNFRDYSY
jgi:hypothetical protein